MSSSIVKFLITLFFLAPLKAAMEAQARRERDPKHAPAIKFHLAEDEPIPTFTFGLEFSSSSGLPAGCPEIAGNSLVAGLACLDGENADHCGTRLPTVVDFPGLASTGCSSGDKYQVTATFCQSSACAISTNVLFNWFNNTENFNSYMSYTGTSLFANKVVTLQGSFPPATRTFTCTSSSICS